MRPFVALGVLAVAAGLAASAVAGPREEVREWRIPIPRDKNGITIISCAPLPVTYRGGGIVAAIALLTDTNIGPTPPRAQPIVLLGHGYYQTKYCAVATRAPEQDRPATATLSQSILRARLGQPYFTIRFPKGCPFASREPRTCEPLRPTTIRITGSGKSTAACDLLTSGASPVRRFLTARGPFGRGWRVLASRGKLEQLRPADVAPALLERICGIDSGRAQRLARTVRPDPPTEAFQLGAYATYAHGTRGSNVCVFVWTRPTQPPLRGGVTLTGPGFEQTKAFTTLGSEVKTRVVFTVTERARYVADVTLAGKTARAGAELGLAPTTSGEFACPAP